MPWRPLTDAEWEAIGHLLLHVHPDRGRPLANPRRAFDACFHAACSGRPWRELPPGFGKPASIHRLFVRWAQKGLWGALLKYVARPRPEAHCDLSAIAYWACRVFRRASRILGLAGIVLARRLGMDSALRAPSWWLPDPDLAHVLHARHVLPAMARFIAGEGRRILGALPLWRRLLRTVTGRARISGAMAPA